MLTWWDGFIDVQLELFDDAHSNVEPDHPSTMKQKLFLYGMDAPFLNVYFILNGHLASLKFIQMSHS